MTWRRNVGVALCLLVTGAAGLHALLSHRAPLLGAAGVGTALVLACAMVASRNERQSPAAPRSDPTRLPLDARMQHLHHRAAVGALAAGIIHDIGTPLNVISGRATMIGSGEASPAEIIDNANTIRQQCQRIAAMVRSLLTYARGSTPAVPQSVPAALREDIALLEPIARTRRVKLELAPDAHDLFADVDPFELRQAVVNLLLNAIQAMPNGGRARLEVGPHPGPGGEPWLYVAIEDAGGGLSAGERIFQPFHSTKPPTDAAGLGLTVTKQIVDRRGGSIDVAPGRDGGTRVTLFLPQRSPT